MNAQRYYVAPSEASASIDCWKLCLYGGLVIFAMCADFLLMVFSSLLTTGIVVEWTIYFVVTTLLLLWTWINHIVSVRVICNQSLVASLRTYMIISYCVQLSLSALLSLPIFGFYSNYPDAQGLWIAVGFAGGFHWLLLAGNFFVFYFVLTPTTSRKQPFVYIPVEQVQSVAPPVLMRNQAYRY